jgi:hypothetical protein
MHMLQGYELLGLWLSGIGLGLGVGWWVGRLRQGCSTTLNK